MRSVMTTAQTTVTSIRSTLANDPDLAGLVQLFVDEMPRRVETLSMLMAAEDWQEMARAVHQFKGAAGSHGFHELTPYAARLEAAIGQQQAYAARELLEALREACGRVRAT